MVEEQQPAKKVVKRVVKKAVAKPTSSDTSIRYGRPVATKSVTTAKAKTESKVLTKTARPRVEVGAKVGAAGKALASRSSSAASGFAGAARSTTTRVGHSVGDAFDSVRAWRIPHWDPMRASIFTGALVGLLSVGLGIGAKMMFTAFRGVASGGGRWGSLTFVVVTFVAFVFGELLLSAFGAKQARLITFLGIVLAIVAILGLFVGPADTNWAFVLVPALGAITFAASHWLLTLAESSSTLPE